MTERSAPTIPLGSATVAGTVNGIAVAANDAAGTALSATNEGVTVTSRIIAITSFTNACSCGAQSDSTNLVLGVGALGTAVATGTYSFPNDGNQAAHAQLVVSDPMTSVLPATSGSITISEISPSMVAGSFDIAFTSGDRLTGTFSAPTCAIVAGEDASCP